MKRVSAEVRKLKDQRFSEQCKADRLWSRLKRTFHALEGQVDKLRRMDRRIERAAQAAALDTSEGRHK